MISDAIKHNHTTKYLVRLITWDLLDQGTKVFWSSSDPDSRAAEPSKGTYHCLGLHMSMVDTQVTSKVFLQFNGIIGLVFSIVNC